MTSQTLSDRASAPEPHDGDPSAGAPGAGAPRDPLTRWMTSPAPLARVAVLRIVAYLFIPLDVLRLRPWGVDHGYLPSDWHSPLVVEKLFHIGAPTHAYLVALLWVMCVGAVAGLTGRAPRAVGWTVAVAYLLWMLASMSYGKVDHDRFGFMLLLFVLPSVGRAGLADRTPSEAAGWALRMVQLGAVATYFFAAFAKVRNGGWGWVNGATIAWAVIRRGTDLATPLLDHPWMLRVTQWGMLILEFCSPAIFLLRGRYLYAAVVGLYLFHIVTFATIKIIFWPHLVCLLAFLPLEKAVPRAPARRRATSPRPADQGTVGAAV
jgi:hypothetical protein